MSRTRGGVVAAVLALLVVILTMLFLSRSQSGDSAASGLGQGAATTTATPDTDSSLEGEVVSIVDLGMHSNHTQPSVQTGSIRLNCYPTWREINPAKGVFVWDRMDELVDRARAWGYEDVLHSFCGTPEWAAGAVKKPRWELLGPQSTSAPTDMADWEAYVTEVVKRYKGRITAYQAWNEGTTVEFFQGTPAQLADMTRRLNEIVETHDPDAVAVSASVQQVTPAQRKWGLQYLRELKERSWPIEVLSFHSYGRRDSLEEGRQEAIDAFRRQLSSVDAPSLPVWDTETTYTGQDVTGERAGALVIRSFLDSWRMGVQRVYWYIWFEGFNDFGSIQMRSGSAPAAALERFRDEVVGATFNGCTEAANGLVRCSFNRSGEDLTIVWAEGKPVTVPQDPDTPYENMVTGDSSQATSIRVGGTPLLVDARP